MVTIYTWGPTTAQTVLDHNLAPDVGHAALEVTGQQTVYASFWPERDSLIGRVTSLWKHRPARNPANYAQEIDPDGGFMQRPADHEDEITGLDEDIIVGLWLKLQQSEYDFFRWNCASVCKLLILTALPIRFHSAVQDITGELPPGLAKLTSKEELQATLRELSSSPFIDSHPDELRQIAQATLAAAPEHNPLPSCSQ